MTTELSTRDDMIAEEPGYLLSDAFVLSSEPFTGLSKRFWGKVLVKGKDECWLWLGAVQRGYGAFRLTDSSGRRSQVNAQRVAYTLSWGPIPEGHHVLHRCDTPLCCNPYHLETGTRTQNMRQAAERGRMSTPRDNTRRLTDGDVAHILSDIDAGIPLRQIAQERDVSPATVRRIRNRRSAR